MLSGIASLPQSERRALPRRVRVLTAGSPAPGVVLEAVGAMGFDVDHVFGITEIAGTPISCAWSDEWDTLSPEQRGKLKAR